MNKTCIIAFTSEGARLGEKLDIGDIYVYYKYGSNKHILFKSIQDIIEKCFKEYDTIVFISACGIAVRSIAPFLVHKSVDPGVVVCDDKGRYVISLLSGHIGGANETAKYIADITGGSAVITTATDVNKKFAVDLWAKENNIVLKDFKTAKEISAAVLNGEKVGYKGSLKMPEGLTSDTHTRLGIFVGYTVEKPFEKTLLLAERRIVLGIGCRAGMSVENIEKAVNELFERESLNINSIKTIVSIDLKAEEQGIIDFSKKTGAEFITYSAKYLNSIEGEFSYSEFVKKTTGLDCVCERAALSQGGRLIVKKQKFSGITLAAAVI